MEFSFRAGSAHRARRRKFTFDFVNTSNCKLPDENYGNTSMTAWNHNPRRENTNGSAFHTFDINMLYLTGK